MKPVDEHPRIGTMVRTLRIIVIALCVGLGAFLAYVAFLAPAPEENPGPLLAWVALAVVGLQIPVWIVLRVTMLRKARDAYSRGEIEEFSQRYSAATIVLAAMIEGPGLLATIAYMLNREPVALGVAGGCLFFLILMIPSEGRVNALLEDAP